MTLIYKHILNALGIIRLDEDAHINMSNRAVLYQH